MKKQKHLYQSILAAIAATVAGMNLSARAATIVPTDSLATTQAALAFSPVSLTPAAGRSASLTMTESGPSPYPAYVGTSDPDGTTNASTITVPNTGTGYAPGLLNGVFYTYGVNYTKGALTIKAFDGGDSEIIAVGLLGVFHGSLMSPILGNTATDIIGDLEASLSLPAGVAGTLEPFIGVTAGTLQHDNPSAYTLLNDANKEYSLMALRACK